jgi:hypothetical protein
MGGGKRAARVAQDFKANAGNAAVPVIEGRKAYFGSQPQAAGRNTAPIADI